MPPLLRCDESVILKRERERREEEKEEKEEKETYKKKEEAVGFEPTRPRAPHHYQHCKLLLAVRRLNRS
ncbi:MAG: hypothetical protein Q8P67_28270, partial [archaeon]|nr:hypothetical protein [archaeon]